jgi:hypothetical protein
VIGTSQDIVIFVTLLIMYAARLSFLLSVAPSSSNQSIIIDPSTLSADLKSHQVKNAFLSGTTGAGKFYPLTYPIDRLRKKYGESSSSSDQEKVGMMGNKIGQADPTVVAAEKNQDLRKTRIPPPSKEGSLHQSNISV